jgi:hypothetical protein
VEVINDGNYWLDGTLGDGDKCRRVLHGAEALQRVLVTSSHQPLCCRGEHLKASAKLLD